MNRYELDGLVRDALGDDKTVLICGPAEEARGALAAIAEHLKLLEGAPAVEGSRVVWAHGRAHISFRFGGSVWAVGRPSDLRGRCADVVLLLDSARRSDEFPVWSDAVRGVRSRMEDSLEVMVGGGE